MTQAGQSMRARQAAAKERYDRVVEAMARHDYSRQAVAAELGLSVDVVDGLLRRGKFKRPVPDAPVEASPKAEATDTLKPTERQRYEDTIARLRSESRQNLREEHGVEDLRKAAFKLGSSRIIPSNWSIDLKPPSAGPGVPILMVTDLHVGEAVDRDEMEGVNEYSVEIFRRRYRKLITTTIDVLCSHTVKPEYPGLIYVNGGDTISGSIHDELTETNEMTSHPSLQVLVQEEIAGIEALADVFGRVVVIRVPGNHGRTTKKPRAKKYAELSYDTLGGWMIEQYFKAKRDDRVSFFYPKSGDAQFDVCGWRFLATHGDRIGSRGGQGFIGPAATIMRGVQKTRQQYAAWGVKLDWILIGHFHVAMELPHCFANGALIGPNEFSRTVLRAEPEPPSQWLLIVHPKWGVSQRWKLFVDDLSPRGPVEVRTEGTTVL